MTNLLPIVFEAGKRPVSGEDLNKIVSAINTIAAQAGGEQLVSTPITTAGNGTLTAAAIMGAIIVRTGPTSNYTDTIDTANNIAKIVGNNFISGSTFEVVIKNATAFTQTLAVGTGITLPPTIIVPAFSAATYFGTFGGTEANPTVTFTHISTVPIANSITETAPASTSLTTVGAGTITATGIVGGLTTRTGATSAFTDTTDTAIAIIAAQPGLVNKIGAAFYYDYVNNTVATATITGGTGVTVSGVTAMPPNSWARYLITYTAAATITMVGIEQGYFPNQGNFTANGASSVTVTNAAVTATSNIVFTLKTVGGTVGAYPAIKTITPGTGFTVAATASDTSVYNYEIRG